MRLSLSFFFWLKISNVTREYARGSGTVFIKFDVRGIFLSVVSSCNVVIWRSYHREILNWDLISDFFRGLCDARARELIIRDINAYHLLARSRPLT